MIARAQSRLRGRGAQIRLWTDDVTRIHHVTEWRCALAEVARVLRPGGRFYSEEVLRAAIVHPPVRRLLTHPQADRFDRAQFTEVLRTDGLHPIASGEFAGAFAWVVADRQVAA